MPKILKAARVATLHMDYTDADQKLATIGKELEKDPNNSEAWAAKADILCSMGMYESAILCCDKSLAINPDNVLTWGAKGIALDKLGKHDEANAAFTKAKK
jgi:Flp pilus assembly protein TadD